MIVHEIDVKRIASIEAEYDPPISRHGYAPAALELAPQTMDPPPWEQAKLTNLSGGVHRGENSTKPRG